MSSDPGSAQLPLLPPRIGWASKGLLPDSAVYVTRDDVLLVQTRARAAVRLTIVCRLQLPDTGAIVPFSFALTTVADRSQQATPYDLTDGFLLSLAVFSTDAAMVQQGVFVEVDLVRGTRDQTTRALPMLKGYLDTYDCLRWPYGQEEGCRSDVGGHVTYLGSAPAAGADTLVTVPAGAQWRLLSWRAQLVTSIAAATRQVHLVIDDGANILLDLAANATQITTLTRNYNAALLSWQPTAVDLEIYIPFPFDFDLLAGYRLRTITTSIQAADQWTAPRYQVREMLVQ